MAYCTLADLQAIITEQDLIQLTDDTVPSAAVNTDNVDKAIADASELIDGYLRERYSLPLSPLPGLIGTLACDIAAYRLYGRRARLTTPESVTERYKNALVLLAKIQEGKIALGAGSVTTPEASTGSVSVIQGPDRVFSREKLRDY